MRPHYKALYEASEARVHELLTLNFELQHAKVLAEKKASKCLWNKVKKAFARAMYFNK